MKGYPSIDKPWLKYYDYEKMDVFRHESMYECLKNSNVNNLDATALMYFGKKYTFSEMLNNIDRIAGAFQKEGIMPGDRVIVLGLNIPEILYSIYAINRIGAIACLEYITQSNEKLKEIIEKYNSKYAVVIDKVAKKYIDTLSDAGIEKVFLANTYSSMPSHLKFVAKFNKIKLKPSCKVIEIGSLINNKIEIIEYIAQPDALAVVISTSGTTGIPKRAELTNDAINALAYQGHYVDIEMNVGATMLTPAPPFLAFGISLTMHMPLCNGTTLVLSVSPEPDFVIKQFIKYKPSLFMGGHVFLDKLMASPKVQNMDLSFISAIELGGESISDEYKRKVERFIRERKSYGHIYSGYGMTELAACSTTEQANACQEGSVGIPLCQVNMKSIDTDSGEELTYRSTGEILISSPCMMSQYYDNEKETREAIKLDENGVRWIHTGDLGYIDENGYVYIIGRIKRIEVTIDPVNNAQCKLYPDYVEHILRECDEVEECAVIAIDDELRLRVPVAFVVLKNNNIKLVDSYMNNNYEKYNIPVNYMIVDKIPLRPNGKTDYQELMKLL